jgi:hypothetical protein
MGAENFMNLVPGTTAREAFATVTEQAAWESGHGGYTGTIAEKDSFTMVENKPLPKAEAVELADRLIDEEDERVDDKWGPAGCIPVEGGKWLFFGWASS